MAMLSGVFQWLGDRPVDFYTFDKRPRISMRTLPQDFSRLPEPLQEKITPYNTLFQDILEFRQAETPEERADQLLRLRLLEAHKGGLPKIEGRKGREEVSRRNFPLLQQSLRSRYKPLFHTLLRLTPHPDPALLKEALGMRNDDAAIALLHKTKGPPSPELFYLAAIKGRGRVFDVMLDQIKQPLPSEIFREASQRLAEAGQPERLKQLMQKQTATHPSRLHRLSISALQWLDQYVPAGWKPSIRKISDAMSPDRHFEERYKLAMTQQKQIQENELLSPMEATLKLIGMIKNHRTDRGSRLAIMALLQKPDFSPVMLVEGTDTMVDGMTPLHVAAHYGHADVIKLLLEAPGAHVNLRNQQDVTPLHTASYRDNPNVARVLLDAPGVDINAQNSFGMTPLFMAVYRENMGMMELLLSRPGINVNLGSIHGVTPLHTAVLAMNQTIISRLLNAPGIQVNSRDNEGRTPMGYTTDEQIRALLQAQGGLL